MNAMTRITTISTMTRMISEVMPLYKKGKQVTVMI